jgi:transposase-like protein
MRSPDESALRLPPNSLAFGSNPANRKPWSNWRRALAKYAKRYPEAVRSLAEEEEKTFTFYEFPQVMRRHIQTTNAIESLFSNVRQRTDQIDVFTTEMSCLTIVWATIEGITLRKVPVE